MRCMGIVNMKESLAIRWKPPSRLTLMPRRRRILARVRVSSIVIQRATSASSSKIKEGSGC